LRRVAQRTLTGKTELITSPDLIGRELASPRRRLLAFAIDASLLLMPTIVTALLFAGTALYLTDRAAFEAVRALNAREVTTDEDAVRVLTALLPRMIEAKAEGLPLEAIEAVRTGRTAEGARLIKDANIIFALSFNDDEQGALKPGQIRLELANFIPGVIRGFALFFVPAAYFTLFGLARGRTIGKRLLGLEVVRLDGKRLTLAESFDRFGGYAQVPGTLFIGMADLWRDPNRRLAHDRGAGTVVLRRRQS
ncbi:MAG: RDD family protein, partial [Acidobacteria bacterium]|nr:RDD family protein [Acidobacteriota bacterium]